MEVPKPKNYCRCGCGTEIKATRKWVSGHNSKNNNPNDKVIKGRTYSYVVCDRCQEKVLKRKDQINRRNEKNFCSKECANVFNSKLSKGKPLEKLRTGKKMKCQWCKKDFYAQKATISKRKFCSNSCKFEWFKENPIPEFSKGRDNKGKKNGMYKNGKHAGRGYRGNKKKIKEQLIERDGGKECLLCGIPGDGLHMHRVVYGSQGGKYEASNCIQLCPEDHVLVHSSKKTWLEPLLEYLQEPNMRNRNKLIDLRLEKLGKRHITDYISD